MLLGLNGATTIKADLETDIRVASQAGYGYLEVWSAKLSDYLKQKPVSQIKQTLAASGLQPLSINALENVTFQSPERFAQIQQECALLCERAAALGCRFLVAVPSPLPPGGATREEARRESVEKLNVLLGIARRHGVALAFEFLGEPGCSVQDLALCNEIVEEIDDPSLGMVLDTFHFYSGGSTLDSIQQVDPKNLFVVHLNDSEDLPLESLRDEHRLLPGEGVIPLEAILSRVKATGYEGVYSIELFRPEYWDWDPYRLAVESKKSMETILQQTWQNMPGRGGK
jgi:2-keto-myo-inositol isomerase